MAMPWTFPNPSVTAVEALDRRDGRAAQLERALGDDAEAQERRRDRLQAADVDTQTSVSARDAAESSALLSISWTFGLLRILGIVFGAIAIIFFPIIFGLAGIALAIVGYTRGDRRLGKVAIIVAVAGTVLGFVLGYLALPT